MGMGSSGLRSAIMEAAVARSRRSRMEWKMLLDASRKVKPSLELRCPKVVAARITSIQGEDLEADARVD